MDDTNPTQRSDNHHRCGCCSKAEFEFRDEDLAPELLELKKKMSKEEFIEFMKGLM